jgi:hypothetical protein
VESEEESLAAVVSVAKKGDAATSKCQALGKINPIVDDDDSVFNDSGTSKEVVTQKKKAGELPPNMSMTGSGKFVSVMLFQIMLSDLKCCLTGCSCLILACLLFHQFFVQILNFSISF